MANKTAMQEMLEWTRKTFPMDLDTPRMIEDKIESLLKVEKEQMAEKYDEGHADGYYSGCQDFEEYKQQDNGK
jgi:hypothetical protein